MSQKTELFLQDQEPFEDISQTIEDCSNCGSKVVHSHISDYYNMSIKEVSRCPICGEGNKTKIHIIN